jgi:hypothetical protein
MSLSTERLVPQAIHRQGGTFVFISPVMRSGITSAYVRDARPSFWRTPDGTRVRTEESWEGGELPGPIEAVQAALDASLVRWLAALKIRAEPADAPD